MKKKCSKCGKKFTPGVNGMLSPVACDECLGVERIADIASETSAWLPGETYHLYGETLESAVRQFRCTYMTAQRIIDELVKRMLIQETFDRYGRHVVFKKQEGEA
jgi:hypothetical protein